jgi:tRNA(His) 5'-end guanylyltransferase
MDLVPILIAIVVFWGIKEYLHNREVEAHKNELLKGGLVQRRSQRVHKDAMSRLGREYPNRHLPRRQYFD